MDFRSLIQALSVIFSGYKLHPLRALLVVLALVCACAGLTSVYVLNDAAKTSYANQSRPFLNGVHTAILAKNGHHISVNDYATLRRAGGQNLIAAAQHSVTLNANRTVDFLGLDLFAVLSLNTPSSVQGREQISQLSMVPQSRYLLHPTHFSVLENADIIQNGKLKLSSVGDGKNERDVSVAAYSGSGMGTQLVGDIKDVFEDFQLTNISYILVVGNLGIQSDKLPNHLYVRELNTGIDATELTDSFHLNLLAMGLLMFVVCIFVMMNALHLMMIKRVSNFKILRQLGIPLRTILLACMVELAGIAVLASILGTTLGLELASLLSPAVNQTLQGLYGVYVGFSNISLTQLYSNALIACVVGGGIAIFLPMRVLNRQMALTSTEATSPKTQFIYIFCAAISMTITMLIYGFADGLASAFVMIAGLLLTGCFSLLFVLPLMIQKVAQATPARYALLKWSNADALRVSRKSNIAFCAFFLAVTANIGMNLMVDSFRVATESWLNQRLNADAYIYTNQTDDVVNWLTENYPQVEVNVRQSETGKFNQKDIQIRSYPLDFKHQDAMQFEKHVTDVWDQFAQEKALFINQQFAYSNNLSLGHSIQIQRENGALIEYNIAGVYLDYGNTQPQILLPERTFTPNNQGRKILSITTLDPTNTVIEEMIAEFPSSFERSQILNTQNLLAFSMDTFDKTFVITSGLNLITLLVAGFSLATSVLIIELDNLPQRALLRSMGVSSIALFKLGLFQQFILCLFIMVIATPFGYLLSWLLINVVNLQAFHWVYPLIINPLEVSLVFAMSLSILLATTAAPTLLSIKRHPVKDLACLND